MIAYDPPIHARSTEELIRIKYGTTAEWQQEAIDQAALALMERGIPAAEEQRLLRDWRAAAEARKTRRSLQLKRNAIKSYSVTEMFLIWLFAPLILIGSWHIGCSLLELREEHYRLMLRQRIILLITGTICWALLLPLLV
jgi:hypothetical protein